MHLSQSGTEQDREADAESEVETESNLNPKTVHTLSPPKSCYKGIVGLKPISMEISSDNHSLVPVLLSAQKDHPEQISSVVPTRISSNVSFLIDLSKLSHPEDVLCDDFGAWKQTDTSTKYYLSSSHQLIKTDKTEDSLKVIRRNYKCLSDETLRKLIVSVSTKEGQHPILFIKYSFKGDPHDVTVKVHGNTKTSSASYSRTFKSTKLLLSEEAESVKCVNRATFNVEQAVGGIENAQSNGALPRDRKQTSYLKNKQKLYNNDPIYSITQLMNNYNENGTTKFVRSYTNDDGMPKFIAFLDQQIDDIINFCCNDTEGYRSLLFNDITFELGPFFLLLTVYTNTFLYTANTTTCPVMIGPMMLCLLKDQSTYDTLYDKITSKAPGIPIYMQGTASDCEQALRNALSKAFPHSLLFNCAIHGKKNISEKMTELGLSMRLQRIIKEDIFGDGGLIYASSWSSYESLCQTLKEKWEQLELAEKTKSSFVSYFERYKQDDIKEHMRVQLSRDAGFGDQVVTTNPIESGNAILKRWNAFQSKDPATFLQDAQSLVDEQTSNVQRAFLGLKSKYVVRPEFQNKIITQSQVDQMGKTKALQTIAKYRIDPKRFNEVKAYRPASKVPFSDLPETDKEELGVIPIEEVSNDPYVVLLTTFTRPDVDQLRRKANFIVSKNKVRSGFSKNHFIIQSESFKYRTVRLLADGRFACDHDCLGFERRRICAHSLAAAMYTDKVNQFLATFKNESINLTKLTLPSCLQRGAGKKKAPAKRKQPESVCTNVTLNDIFAEDQNGPDVTPPKHAAVVERSSSGMKMTLKTKPPKKPKLTETSSTPFHLIRITGNIRKCVGCGGKLKDGTSYDTQICVRHKENEYYLDKKMNTWKKTFSNVHYHCKLDCILPRNPSFQKTEIIINIDEVDPQLKEFLKQRFQ
ncbi:uncharacterized protein [Clytia hemisphaerica]|uniref:uncharacterized protein n=1 Tax=Clytia hemisphaerica TaxID=252671 RepID=UPI0034D5A12A